MEEGRRSPLRALAPMALIAFAVAVLFVVATSGVDESDSGSSNGKSSATERPQSRERAGRPAAGKQQGGARSTYTVQVGDTLAGIAEKTGVTVEQLQELNPELDPQALVSGQKIKLRE
jgi:LysM repeat protein